MTWLIIFVAVILLMMLVSKKAPSDAVPKPQTSINISTVGKDSTSAELTGVHVSETKTYILSFCSKGDIVKLQFEPDNKYDEYAIKVFHDDIPIGYISSVDNIEVGEFMRKYDYHSFIYELDYSSGYLDVSIGLVQK